MTRWSRAGNGLAGPTIGNRIVDAMAMLQEAGINK